MTTTSTNCAECGQPSPREGHVEALLAVEILDLRDQLASIDRSAVRFDFCGRGVELANSLHSSVHSGHDSRRLRRRVNRWLGEANRRLDIWQVIEPVQFPGSSSSEDRGRPLPLLEAIASAGPN